jgi:hypothetical protein
MTDAQLSAYNDLLRWAREDGDLGAWGPYLVAADRNGLMVRILVGESPPDGFIIIGVNCGRTAAIWRVTDLQRKGVELSTVQPPRY